MSEERIREAIEVLIALGLPRQQQNDRSALSLLALADLKPDSPWSEAAHTLVGIHGIIEFARAAYERDYAENTRESIRRQTIHQFEQARLIDRNPDDPARPTNSGKTVYALTEEALEAVRAFGTADFDGQVSAFLAKQGALKEAYRRRRSTHEVPLRIPGGKQFLLSPGEHNELQVAIIEELGPRFAPGADVLYVGDTAKKHVVCETEKLTELGIEITQHDKLPDVVLYLAEKNWLFLIEAVTSHGPVNPKRYAEIEQMMADCTAERVYVSAFLDPATFRKYAADIAWETEVWMADHPDHMIHFNGPKFLGPYPKRD